MHDRPEVGVRGGLEQLLQPDQALVVLVQDGEALPSEGVDQACVRLRYESRTWMEVDRVALPGSQEVPSGFCGVDLVINIQRTYVLSPMWGISRASQIFCMCL